MKKREIYLFVSVILLIVDMAIIPVGGMHESNINHEFYENSFLAVCVNMMLCLGVFFYLNMKDERDN